MSTIAQKVVEIIADKMGVAPQDVTFDASFANDLGADSLDAVELVMEAEKVFGIPISDDVAEKLGTVGDVVSYLEANKDKAKNITSDKRD
jgi:acyl carrier protein